jgi:hypothetical protein
MDSTTTYCKRSTSEGVFVPVRNCSGDGNCLYQVSSCRVTAAESSCKTEMGVLDEPYLSNLELDKSTTAYLFLHIQLANKRAKNVT